MPVPTWQEFMAPVLEVLLDGEVRRLRELYSLLADKARLSESERAERLSAGDIKYENRIGWATSYLTRVDALDRPSRGRYAITDIGRKLLADHPNGITERDLRVLADGRSDAPQRWGQPRSAEVMVGPTHEPELDPTEQVLEGIARIHADVAADLLTRLHGKDPAFFEQAVVRLLVAMGYGGADGTARVTQQSNDEGIDGIIDQDTLGLSRVYVQAKRYASDQSVGRPEIQAFVGALSGKADGGVFITTGRFSPAAQTYSSTVPTRVILIDGKRLTDLMIRFNVGVQVKQALHIVEVDEDFFE